MSLETECQFESACSIAHRSAYQTHRVTQGAPDGGDVDEAMQEVRRALLEADVNFKVVKDFVAGVRERAVGAGGAASAHPGADGHRDRPRRADQRAGRGARAAAQRADRPPTIIMLVGLQGSGKTTHAAKLALHLRKQGRNPLLVAADVYRPAAIDQLQTLASRSTSRSTSEGDRAQPGQDRRATRCAARRATRATTRSSSTPPAACTSTSA